MIDYRLFRGLEKRSLTISNQFLRGLNDVEFDNYIKDVKHLRRMDSMKKEQVDHLEHTIRMQLGKTSPLMERIAK